jgi:hypothetical protein
MFIISVLVIRAGFEPTARSLEGCCSIQLSYRTSIYGGKISDKFLFVTASSKIQCLISVAFPIFAKI